MVSKFRGYPRSQNSQLVMNHYFIRKYCHLRGFLSFGQDRLRFKFMNFVMQQIASLRDHPMVDEKVELKNSVQPDLLQERCYRIKNGWQKGFFPKFFIEHFQVGDTVWNKPLTFSDKRRGILIFYSQAISVQQSFLVRVSLTEIKWTVKNLHWRLKMQFIVKNSSFWKNI